MTFDLVPSARALPQSRRERILIAPLAAVTAAFIDAEGAAVQHALAELSGAFTPCGFKERRNRQQDAGLLGDLGPDRRFMRAEDVSHMHVDVRFDDFIKPGVDARWRCGWPFDPVPITASH